MRIAAGILLALALSLASEATLAATLVARAKEEGCTGRPTVVQGTALYKCPTQAGIHYFLIDADDARSVSAAAKESESAPTYTIVRQWTIPNGGFGKVILLSKSGPNEQELRALGEKLKRDTASDRNAWIFVYDDERAARNRDAALSEKLSVTDMKQHNRHMVASYARNANTGYHMLLINVAGLDGPSINVKYP
jgi:hypothetical protein